LKSLGGQWAAFIAANSNWRNFILGLPAFGDNLPEKTYTKTTHSVLASGRRAL